MKNSVRNHPVRLAKFQGTKSEISQLETLKAVKGGGNGWEALVQS